MGQFQDVQAFVSEAKRLSQMGELQDLLADGLGALGFKQFAFIHHVPGISPQENVVRLSNYPDSWIDVIRKRRYFSDDPIHAACERSAVAFTWSKLDEIITLSRRQVEIMTAWGDHGFGDSFTVPIHIPGEAVGSCSMGVRAGQALPEDCLPAAQYMSSFAFEAARRIARLNHGAGEATAPRARDLSQRQFDCLVLVARGKSDWDIAQILGISHQTVHQHVEEAKRRYGVASRTQLVVHALYASQLAFADIVDPGQR